MITGLLFPTHPIVSTALDMARVWCAGHSVEGAPALTRAVRAARELGTHAATATPELLAAALLHDAPRLAATAGYRQPQDLDAVLTRNLSGEVARVIWVLARERQALAEHRQVAPPIGDQPALLVSASEKVAALACVIENGDQADDTRAYWTTRTAFLHTVPHYRAFYRATNGHLPADLSLALYRLVIRAEIAHNLHHRR